MVRRGFLYVLCLGMELLDLLLDEGVVVGDLSALLFLFVKLLLRLFKLRLEIIQLLQLSVGDFLSLFEMLLLLG